MGVQVSSNLLNEELVEIVHPLNLQARSVEVHKLLGTLGDLPLDDSGFSIHIHELGAGPVVKDVVEVIKRREGTAAFPYVSPLSLFAVPLLN
jgi:hypothetical protein